MSQPNNGAIPPTAALQEAIKRELQDNGEARTVERIGLSRISLAKIAAGLPVRRGTAALAALRLGMTDEIGRG
jgi:hypothetical protein